ncbi:uncharacterized protein LOC105220758 isoform X2 [Zeugodacus cucurbitae]|uniref:uncharacterized protein LOC105220758 isoform X2 n=1 Tax=Zeugodacus cucurbitae TaxID=28588 RepID=UPI0023D8FE6A|nr:uncharacterized protein LOC105220758 isoform X2 [Zeugodacus cucurbitae]
MDPNNMLFRLEELTAEKLYEEYGISKEQRMKNPGLYKMFVEDFIPTREDLERKIDEEKLKELCLRLPCRVLMHRWNPVQDFVNQFTRQGRIQRWTKEKTQKLLVKAVNRHRNVCLYSDDEIRKEREREWCERKKENLMLLDVWEYDRQLELQNEQSEEEQRSNCNTENNNTTESATTADDTKENAQTNEVATASAIHNIEAEMAQLHGSPALQSTPSDMQTTTITPSDTMLIPPLSPTTNLNPADYTTNNILPQSQVQPISLPSTQNTEELAGREYVEMVQQIGVNEPPRLEDFINVNTESMPLEDSTTIGSEDVFDGECTPPYYEFNTHVSMTSTQSPTAK